jgi:predicted transcriptional regulator
MHINNCLFTCPIINYPLGAKDNYSTYNCFAVLAGDQGTPFEHLEGILSVIREVYRKNNSEWITVQAPRLSLEEV